MSASGPSTCWTVIRAAAAGAAPERDAFARRYAEPLAAYFAARWRGGPLAQECDDAVQEVFVECLRDGGALARARPAEAATPGAGGFQPFLYGVARNVARRFEERRAARKGAPAESVELDRLPIDEPSLSRAFDRAFAQALLREAAALQRARAVAAGERAVRRVDLLARRFGDDQAIREVAREWGVDAATLHHEFATARREFVLALQEVVAFHDPRATPGEVARRCAELARLVAAG